MRLDHLLSRDRRKCIEDELDEAKDYSWCLVFTLIGLFEVVLGLLKRSEALGRDV